VNAVVVGVGSNLGAREAAIRAAHALLDAREGIEVRAVSKIYETEPLGPPQPRYLNAAFRLATTLPPSELLRVLLRTERRLGRRRVPEQRWGPRSIDLDLLWDQRGPHAAPGLTVPHPELEKRDFALAPLLDVAPELGDIFGSSLEQLGGAPPVWGRDALVRVKTTSQGFEVGVEADSLADACALCAGRATANGRPWSTRHFSIEPTAECFADTLRDLLRTGFWIHRATISLCSKTQWALEFHGVNTGNPLHADVRLRTTLATDREIQLQLSVLLTPA